MNLKIIGATPVEDFSEEISKLTESKKQTVTEIRCECSQIRNRYHLRRRFTVAREGCRERNGEGLEIRTRITFTDSFSLFLSLGDEEEEIEKFRERNVDSKKKKE
jgi:hypothetical protein